MARLDGPLSGPLTTNFGNLMDSNVSRCVSVSAKCDPEVFITLTTFNTGSVRSNSLSQAKPDIEARTAQYEKGQTEFAILSLVRNSLLARVLLLLRT